MTAEQFYTAGHLARSRGAAGISTFNFVYYRQHHDNPKIGPFAEPPFGVFKHLNDPAFLAAQPQHYFAPCLHGSGVLPDHMESGATMSVQLDMAPPAGGWKRQGRLRVQANSDLDGSRWQATCNGTLLDASNDVTEPYPNPYPNCLGQASEFRAWKVPPAVLRDGINTLQVTLLVADKPLKPIFVDVAMP
jgi:hypothetical protein